MNSSHFDLKDVHPFFFFFYFKSNKPVRTQNDFYLKTGHYGFIKYKTYLKLINLFKLVNIFSDKIEKDFIELPCNLHF